MKQLLPPPEDDNEKGRLFLARDLGQSIKIGKDIDVMITRVRGDKVVICIEAPKNITILRTELLDSRN